MCRNAATSERNIAFGPRLISSDTHGCPKDCARFSKNQSSLQMRNKPGGPSGGKELWCRLPSVFGPGGCDVVPHDAKEDGYSLTKIWYRLRGEAPEMTFLEDIGHGLQSIGRSHGHYEFIFWLGDYWTQSMAKSRKLP